MSAREAPFRNCSIRGGLFSLVTWMSLIWTVAGGDGALYRTLAAGVTDMRKGMDGLAALDAFVLIAEGRCRSRRDDGSRCRLVCIESGAIGVDLVEQPRQPGRPPRG